MAYRRGSVRTSLVPALALASSLVVPLSACGPDPAMAQVDGIVHSPCSTVVLVPGADTTPEERTSVEGAILLWKAVGVTTLTLEENPAAAHVPLVFVTGPSNYHGLYDSTKGIVYVNRDLSGEPRDITVAHEVGHSLGLPHVPVETRRSVMNIANLDVVPTNDDDGALRARWSCPAVP